MSPVLNINTFFFWKWYKHPEAIFLSNLKMAFKFQWFLSNWSKRAKYCFDQDRTKHLAYQNFSAIFFFFSL